MTETYGPAVICEWRAEWNALSIPDQAAIKARQGVGNVVTQEVRVVDAQGRDVPADGETLGEIALRGNNIMLGYYRDPGATEAAAPDGWLRTGDLGVMEPDRYVRLTDRSKDVIISGGENIASVEVEQMLERHPDVLEAAVVGAPDPTWGEIPSRSSPCERATRRTKRRLSRMRARTSRASKLPSASCSASCPRPARARFRNSRSASGRSRSCHRAVDYSDKSRFHTLTSL